MAKWQELLKLIRKGKSPVEIVDHFKIPPSIFRRMLAGRNLRAQLKLEEDLAAVIAAHKTAANTHTVAQKLDDLTDAENTETARKACLALLAEGLRETESRATAPGRPEKLTPWSILNGFCPSATPVRAGTKGKKKRAGGKRRNRLLQKRN